MAWEWSDSGVQEEFRAKHVHLTVKHIHCWLPKSFLWDEGIWSCHSYCYELLTVEFNSQSWDFARQSTIARLYACTMYTFVLELLNGCLYSVDWTRDWTVGLDSERKLHSSDFEAAHTLLHYSILTSHQLNSRQTTTRYQYLQDQTKFQQPFLPIQTSTARWRYWKR